MRLITIAIHTYPYARELKARLEQQGISATIQNVNLEEPTISPGVRVRIDEADLVKALRVVEHPEIFDEHAHASASEVVLPIDFSPCSMNAARAAFALAHKIKGKVVVVHAYEGSAALQPNPLSATLDLVDDPAAMATMEEAELEEDLEIGKSVKEVLEAFKKRLRKQILKGDLATAPFETVLLEGLPEDVINEVARQRHPALIVMGTRGAGTKERQVIGSVTAEVLDTCRVAPIYTIPEEMRAPHPGGVKHVIALVTPDQQDILALDTLCSLFGNAMKVTLLELPSKRRPANPAGMENLCNYCRQNFPGTTFETLTIPTDKLGDEIMRLDRNPGEVDLICVANKKKNLVARFFNPTVAHRLLFHADIPMLAIPV